MFKLRTFIAIFAFGMMPALYSMGFYLEVERAARGDKAALALVKKYLAEGADVNQGQPAPLMIATGGKRYSDDPKLFNIDLITLLLEAGANPNAADSEGYIPLSNIVTAERAQFKSEAARLLLIAGANPLMPLLFGNDPQFFKVTLLGQAIREESTFHEILSLFFKASILYGMNEMVGRAIKSNYPDSYSYYIHKVLASPFDKVVAYISEGPSFFGYLQLRYQLGDLPVNQRDELGATLLMYAAASGNLPAVQFLLKKGANVFISTHSGKTVQTIVEYILNHKPKSLGLEKKTTLIKNQEKRLEQKATCQKILALIKKEVAFKEYRAIRVLSKPREGFPAIPSDVVKAHIYPLFVAGLVSKPVGGPLVPGAFQEFPPAQEPMPAYEGSPIFQPKLGWWRWFVKDWGMVPLIWGVAYLWDKRATSNLNKDELYSQLVTAFANKDFEGVHKVSLNNLSVLREISLDVDAKQELKKLIEQAELDLINETAQAGFSLNPLYYLEPSVATQLQHLAAFSHNLDNPIAEQGNENDISVA